MRGLLLVLIAAAPQVEVMDICDEPDFPPFYRYPPPASCWKADTCPPSETVFKAWLAPDLRPLLLADFDDTLRASLTLVTPLHAVDDSEDEEESP